MEFLLLLVIVNLAKIPRDRDKKNKYLNEFSGKCEFGLGFYGFSDKKDCHFAL